MQRGFPVQHIPAICLFKRDLLDEIATKSMQSIELRTNLQQIYWDHGNTKTVQTLILHTC